MRAPRLLLTAILCLTDRSYAQRPFPEPERPFGKYLVEICSVDQVQHTISCEKPKQDKELRIPQSITLKLVCAPGSPVKCTPPYPVAANTDFYVNATSDSGLDVSQSIVSGSVQPQTGGPGLVHYRVTRAGTIVIQATQNGDKQYAPAAPVQIAIAVTAETGTGCELFPAPDPSAQKVTAVDLQGLVTLLGNPTPYVLSVQGPETILIYSSRMPIANPPKEPKSRQETEEKRRADEEAAVLQKIEDSLRALFGRSSTALGLMTTTPFSVELTIPHAQALGDLATRLGTLNYSQFTIQDVGADKVRINAPKQPDCDVWKSFLGDVRHAAWQVVPSPLTMRLFYVANSNAATYTAAPDVVAAFNSLAGSSAAPAASSAPAAAVPATNTPSSGGGAGSPAPSSSATISVTQPPGSVVAVKSDTTPCVAAGLATGNPNSCVPSGALSSGGASGASNPVSNAPAVPKPISMTSLGTDQLIFSTTNPGDEAQVEERRRLLALLDLPRPEMIINGWVMQNSTTSGEAIGAFDRVVKDAVNRFNEALERVVLNGWSSLKQQMTSADYFDQPFYHYITDRFVTDTNSNTPPKKADEAAQQFLDNSPTKLAQPPSGKLSDFGICDPGHYCLGYTNIFHPLKPRLMDLFLTIAAARNPMGAALQAAAVAEQGIAAEGAPPPVTNTSCEHHLPDADHRRDRCIALYAALDFERILEQTTESRSCESDDLLSEFGAHNLLHAGRPRMFLNCFRHASQIFLGHSGGGPEPSFAGLLRSHIADFLFNYKISQQYTHEFGPYPLSRSADTLNSDLNVLADAFNRDVVAFQRYLRADVQYEVDRLNREHDQRCCVKKLFSVDKPSFFNDGIVTVRTISGQWTGASTTSQSFLNASGAPTLSSFLSSLPGGSGSTPTTVPQGLANVANAYQTTYAQIGRSLTLTAIPRSLAAASSAEIVISLFADESTAPTYWGSSQNQQANISRVSQHDTQTRVRVESVKLFEISSFSAALQKSQSRFPLLPPFVQIPYVGTLAGIPLPPVKEFHTSTAIVSAIIVPTAADLAYGLDYLSDQLVYGPPGVDSCAYTPGAAPDGLKLCQLRRAVSLSDFGNKSIWNYNRAMVRCLATNNQAPYSNILGFTDASRNDCAALSFDQVPQ